MFTGIIEDLGRVAAADVHSGGATLRVETRLATGDLADVKLGDSIAVMGACLTVTHHARGALAFDVSPESLRRTTLGRLGAGRKVHLERALRLGGRLDGHLVQGHVDAIARLVDKARAGDGWELTYALPDALLPQVVEKGSIALDGVSLTIARLVGPRISVAVVPHTAAHTLLTDTAIGDAVNVETDVLGKYVQRVLSLGRGAVGGPPAGPSGGGDTRPAGSLGGGLDLAFLAEHGFAR